MVCIYMYVHVRIIATLVMPDSDLIHCTLIVHTCTCIHAVLPQLVYGSKLIELKFVVYYEKVHDSCKL